MIDLPSSPPHTGHRVWEPSNRPSSLEFTIYEDPHENAGLSVPCPLAEGFHTVEEDKENLLVNPFEYYSSSSDDEIHPYIDWSEAAQRPRDAFGISIQYDGPPSIEQTLPDTEVVHFRRGRHVLAPITIPDAENSDNEDGRAATMEEPQVTEEDEEADKEEVEEGEFEKLEEGEIE